MDVKRTKKILLEFFKKFLKVFGGVIIFKFEDSLCIVIFRVIGGPHSDVVNMSND
jgi:hypothetical protein